MEFKKYQHVERLGNLEVEGITEGTCYIFPKLDGTNGSAWLDSNGNVRTGSRKRLLSIEDDNAGFCAKILEDNNIKNYLNIMSTRRLYGEFLKPHTIRTYQADAWNKFYVFDVYDADADGIEYPLPYEKYKEELDAFEIEYIPPIAVIKNPKEEDLYKLLDKNTYLIQDGQGIGEGIVIKNYDYRNRYGRQTWAKIVRNDFKANHTKTMGCPELQSSETVEDKIVEQFCTPWFIEKEYAKIVTEKDGWSSKYIPMLLGRVYSEMIKEEIWEILKKYKHPKIDFNLLNKRVTQQIKEVKSELF